jgi:drug/metabolite transporter (DMT)-like permease
VNQSLIVVLETPNLITAIQAFSMALATCLWFLVMERPALQAMPIGKLSRWLVVAVLFAVYQLLNHWVYATCSLSERTVFTNLSPLISLALERLVMPAALKPQVSFGGKMALSLMVVGSVLFSIQNPSFTVEGIGTAMLLLLGTVPYRLAQRHMLAEGQEIPLTVLACIDGLVLAVPSSIISASRHTHFWSLYESSEASIFFMLVLSITTFIGLHISGLAMLRLGSATTYLVFSNIAGLVTIGLGILFFGDRALGTTLACIGLLANVASGIWYSAEVRLADQATNAFSEPKLEPKESK